jgi:hypothetical protein
MYSIRIKSKTLVSRLLLICLLIAGTAIVAAGLELPSSKASDPPTGLLRPAPVPLPSNLVIPHYYPGPPPFRSGESLVYQASWLGIPAAEARIVLSKNESDRPSWTAKLWLRSSTEVDLLYRMRDYVYEDFNRDNLRPRDMHILQHEKRRRDEWSIRFDDQDHLVTSAKRNAQGRMWVREFSGGEPWGPFSGAMLALSLPLTVGETYTFDVFSGGNRYVLAFNVDRRESITTPLGTTRALRIIPSVVWLSEGKFLNQVNKIVIWVADDEQHLPLRIEAAAFVGYIRVDLVRVFNSPNAYAATVVEERDQVEDEQSSALLTPGFWSIP